MRATVLTWIAMMVGACLRTPGYQCAQDDQCALGGVAGRCEPSGACSTGDPGCPSGFRWAASAPEAGTCVAPIGPGADAQPDAPRATVNECLVQPALAATASSCTAKVCADDARCCTREWSAQCVQRVEQTCGRSCSQRLATVSPGLVRVQAWTGAGFTTIWSHALENSPELSAVAWGDLDGDLDPDLLTCVHGGSAIIWQNGGTCGEMFCPLFTATGITDCAHADWIDLDHDGDLDVVMGGAYWGGFWNNDSGLFGTTTADLFHGAFNADMAWADLDGDGDLDLGLAQYGASASVEKVTPGAPGAVPVFGPLWTDPDPSNNRGSHVSIAFGDVDRDGVLDVLSAGGLFTDVWRNTSTTGGFAITGTTPLFEDTAHGGDATLADADEDGDLDILEVSDGGNVVMFKNQHAETGGGFIQTPAWRSSTIYGRGRIAVGDVDGDGHLDIVAGVPPLTTQTPTAVTTWTSVFLARPGAPWKFGTATDTASAVDVDQLDVTDLALAPAW
ncbi:MAG: VCBS repeat-containing protein [Deltaproteobacteria bacterium]|nr:VCBS repeat-containing protein [Deltaproteobacteria bacterium]